MVADDVHADRVRRVRGRTLVDFHVTAHPWTADGTAVVSDTGLVAIETVTIGLDKHDPGAVLPKRGLIGSAVERVLPIEHIRRVVREEVLGTSDLGALLKKWPASDGSTTREGEASKQVARRRGRPALDDRHYAEVAYVRLVAQGWDVADVTDAVREELSRRHGRDIPKQTVKNWIQRATADGWLTEGGRRRDLGPRFRAWLQEGQGR